MAPNIIFTEVFDGPSYGVRVDSVEEIRCIWKKVSSYINIYEDGCILSLPGDDISYPLQVEFDFIDKDLHPHLQSMYDFFKGFYDKPGEFRYATVRLVVTAAEANKWLKTDRFKEAVVPT